MTFYSLDLRLSVKLMALRFFYNARYTGTYEDVASCVINDRHFINPPKKVLDLPLDSFIALIISIFITFH